LCSYDEVRTIAIDSEPGFLALGEAHVAAGMNNQAWFYRIGPPAEAMEFAAQRVNQRDYLGTVDEVALNDRLAAVRFEGRVSVHVIEHAEDPTESMDFQLPESGQDADISCIQMTNEFLVFGTQRGTIHYFYLPDRVSVNEYRHEAGLYKLNSVDSCLLPAHTSLACLCSSVCLASSIVDLRTPGFKKN
jgi:WD repeat-containing protein 19